MSTNRLPQGPVPRTAQGLRLSELPRGSGCPTLATSDDEIRSLVLEHDKGKCIDRMIDINDLPTELLCDILEIASDGTEKTFDFAICASLVSKRWKEVAFGAPKLWRRIDAADAWKTITLSLARSKQVPFDIRILLQPEIGEIKGINRIKRLARLISPERHRFRTFTFHYYYPRWLEAASLLLTSEPVIEVDTLDVRDEDFPGASRRRVGPTPDQITFAPRHLRYDGIHMPRNRNLVPAFSESLRSLDIRWSRVGARTEDLVLMLSNAANLEYLRLTGLRGHASNHLPPDPATTYCFPSLREVVFESLSVRRLWDLGTCMHMPALERLLIDSIRNRNPGPAILRICERSPRLQYLRLNAAFSIDRCTWKALFSNLPSLTDFYLFLYGSEDRLGDLNCLIADPTSSESVLCPKLASVTFDRAKGVHREFVVRLVKSRMDITRVSPIRSLRWKLVTVDTATELCKELHEVLQANALDLFLEYAVDGELDTDIASTDTTEFGDE